MGHVLWLANHPSMQTWQNVWWPSHPRRIMFLPISTSPMHITHCFPTSDWSAWNCSCWRLWGAKHRCSCSMFMSCATARKSKNSFTSTYRSKFSKFSFSSTWNCFTSLFRNFNLSLVLIWLTLNFATCKRSLWYAILLSKLVFILRHFEQSPKVNVLLSICSCHSLYWWSRTLFNVML